MLAWAVEPAQVCGGVLIFLQTPLLFLQTPLLFSKPPCFSPTPPPPFFSKPPHLSPTPPFFSNPPRPLTVPRRAGCDDDGPAPPLPLCLPCVYALLVSQSGTLSARSFPFNSRRNGANGRVLHKQFSGTRDRFFGHRDTHWHRD